MQSERLTLRPPELGDAATLFEFMGDSHAMRFTQVRASVAELADYLAVHEAQRDVVGCAPWVLVGRREGRIIGFGGLYEDPFEPGWGLEVGYFLHPAAWGQGYAGELVRLCIAEAARLQRGPTLAAFAHPANLASQRVLQRAGFGQQRFLPQMNRWLYAISLAPAPRMLD